MKVKGKLTPKQERFIAEYLVDMNATQAAIRAGYSAKTADTISGQLLRKSWVREEIKKRQAHVEAKIELTTERILRDLGQIAMDSNNSVRDRMKAYELVGKHLGMFTGEQDDKAHSKVVRAILFANIPADVKKLEEMTGQKWPIN